MKSVGVQRIATTAVALIVLTACGSAESDTAPSLRGVKATEEDKQPARVGKPDAFAIGINVAGLQYGSRAFMNLIYGSSWQMQGSNRQGGYEDVPATWLDGNGWVKWLPTGYRVIRRLSVPLVGGRFICRYQGSGKLDVSGARVSNVSTSSGVTRFTLPTTYPAPEAAVLSYMVDPADYIRNIDCRETSQPSSGTLAPEFASALSAFKIIRFMKWQTATEGNWAVTWERRNKPGDGDYTKNDGVPIELMVQTANDASADLWVTVPWNADNQYITSFATYVRDHLAPKIHVYVEVSNEVWNGGYPVAAQAAKEGRDERLPSASGSGSAGNLERYAEKTKQVMALWSSVFQGQTARMVRVASFQHVSPYFSGLLLNYMSLSRSIDALATAPYFGYEATDAMSLDQIMAALPREVTASIDFGVQQKAIARKYGLRYVAYEAGQSVVLHNNLALEQKVERDPRMYDIYRQFIAAWKAQIGDALNLFALEGRISIYGGWGLTEYVGQPISLAPKLHAVGDFFGTRLERTGLRVVYSPAHVCAGRSVIPFRGTCATEQAFPAAKIKSRYNRP